MAEMMIAVYVEGLEGCDLIPVAYPGGCFGCSSTPLNDRIHCFVSAMAQDCIYAKVAPPTTLERKRFGYK